jgi:hypothetical protein
LGHGLPNLLPVTFSVPCCHLPVLYLEQIYGILPTSISPSTSGLQHGPASSHYVLGIRELFTLLHDELTVISWRYHIIIKLPDVQTVSNSPHPLGLWTSEYMCEDFPFKVVNHTDGFLERGPCFTTI